MGKFSRDKGKRVELGLVHYLKRLGWQAQRVPLSGATTFAKGDVLAEKDTHKVIFECKSKAKDFQDIYDLYFAHTKRAQDDCMPFVIPAGEGPAQFVTISTSVDAMFSGSDVYQFHHNLPEYEKYSRTFKKVGKLQKLVGGADILVLRGDRRPFLFLRYR